MSLITLNIFDKNVIPVAQPKCRIPFALPEKVRNDIKNLEVNDITEDITNEPTPWLNPLVVVKEGGNNVRLCLDMGSANTTIERIRFPLPKVDELVVKLRNATRFPKLDSNKTFHQLELYPEPRYITAFQTEDRINP